MSEVVVAPPVNCTARSRATTRLGLTRRLGLPGLDLRLQLAEHPDRTDGDTAALVGSHNRSLRTCRFSMPVFLDRRRPCEPFPGRSSAL
jgi:hypothetical protein